jgi:hypothetical protein
MKNATATSQGTSRLPYGCAEKEVEGPAMG